MEAWRLSGVVEEWKGRIVELHNGEIIQKNSSDRFVGVPGMNAVCKHLARDVNVVCRMQIQTASHNSRWELSDENGIAGEFDRVIVAIPNVQAVQLLRDLPWPNGDLAGVRMMPCWAAMFAFGQTIELPADGAFVSNSPISWIARDSSKPGRGGGEDCWVVHASPEFSVENIEVDPAEVIELLKAEFFRITKSLPQKPLHAVAHRWRYANASQHLTSECLFDAEQGIAVCGDWCKGNRVEAAFLSGISAAGCLMRHTLR